MIRKILKRTVAEVKYAIITRLRFLDSASLSNHCAPLTMEASRQAQIESGQRSEEWSDERTNSGRWSGKNGKNWPYYEKKCFSTVNSNLRFPSEVWSVQL